uniref:Uncharacterized protein n=1 Tax=Rhizophora mucronata TaxID=61149 RepID=A0A2P2PZT5_RHIMU
MLIMHFYQSSSHFSLRTTKTSRR